jgi:hypothetical protein
MLGVTQPACLIYIIAGIINLKKTNFNWIIYKQGFETTGLAMTWFLYTIAKHPKHQVGL